MARRRTLLLSTLLLVTLLTAVVAFLRMGRLKEAAESAGQELVDARRAMADIRRWRASPGRAAAASMESPQLAAKLREAATAAGLAAEPGMEPDDKPVRLGESDYSELRVFLRFEPMTLRQLTTFLVALGRIEPSGRVQSIELAPPENVGAPIPPGVGANGEDVWLPSVQVNFLTYTPRKPQP
jgi:hypothetical protein